MFDLYGMGSPNVTKVVLMLEEVGQPYRLHHVNVWAGEQHGDAFRALAPNGKVPVLVDSDGPAGLPLTVFESGAILWYLAEKTGVLWPLGLRERTAVHQWLMFQMAGVGPMFGQALHFDRVTPDPIPYARARYLTELERLHDVVESRLQQTRFIAGDDYSVADVSLYPWLNLIVKFKLGPGARPHLQRWLDEVAARPAAQRVRAAAPFRDQDRLAQQAATPDQLDRYFGRGAYARV